MRPSNPLVGFCLLTRLFAQSLPEVDLGYEIHRALEYDVRPINLPHYCVC